MATVKELKKAVSQLSPEKLSEFRSWYEKFDEERWDEEITNDVKSGKLDTLANEAIEDYEKGNFMEL
jgi:major membrane immunogen (membrane-anchored lipoprotein)